MGIGMDALQSLLPNNAAECDVRGWSGSSQRRGSRPLVWRASSTPWTRWTGSCQGLPPYPSHADETPLDN